MTHSERNEAIKKTIAAYSKKSLVDKKTARASLISSGIYTQGGDLHRNYGGPTIKKKA
jgi:hypothetical protein